MLSVTALRPSFKLYVCLAPVEPWSVDLIQNSLGLRWVLVHRFADEKEYSPVLRTPRFRSIVPISEGASRMMELGEVQLVNRADYRE